MQQVKEDLPIRHSNFASAVLGDGIVFVAGGEYNGGTSIEEVTAAEIYDPVVDSPFAKIGDSPSCVLPDGRVLLASTTQQVQHVQFS